MSGVYLRRNRFHILYYRRVLPIDVRHAFNGKREVVVSLRTAKRKDALPIAQMVNLTVESKIRHARGEPMPDMNGLVHVDPLAVVEHLESLFRDSGKAVEIETSQTARQALGLPERPPSMPNPSPIPSIAEPQAPQVAIPQVTIAELADRFFADLIDSQREGFEIDENLDRYARRLSECYQGSVADFTPDHARKVRSLLKNTPANNAKHRGKTIPELVAIRQEGDEGLSVKSINDHLEAYQRMFEFARREGLHHGLVNPFHKIRVLVHPLADKKGAEPFTDDELKRIFKSEIFTNYGQDQFDAPYRYWLPILSYVTGIRPQELSYLEVADYGVENGIHYLNIRLEQESEIQPDQSGKSLKTASARRKVPLYREVVTRLRFDRFVEFMRQHVETSKNKRLFQTLTYTKGSGYSRKYSDWFNGTFLKGLGIHEKRRKIAYSFRDTHATAAEIASVPHHRIEQLQGRSIGGRVKTTGEQHYIAPSTLEVLNSEQQKIRFDALKYVKPFPDRFDPS